MDDWVQIDAATRAGEREVKPLEKEPLECEPQRVRAVLHCMRYLSNVQQR